MHRNNSTVNQTIKFISTDNERDGLNTECLQTAVIAFPECFNKFCNNDDPLLS